MLESIGQDLRYGVRQLKQSPGFTLVAVLSLALGIGANTAMFQLVDAIRLRMLPVERPKELVTVDFQKGSRRSGWWSSRSARFTSAQWNEIRSRQQAFSGMLAWSATRFNLANGGEARYAEGLFVSGEFFRHLGVQPVMGRTFEAGDDNEACSSGGAVISHSFWQREYGGDPSVIGRKMTLNGYPFTVLGVTPAPFFGVEVGSQYDVAIPLCADRLMSEDKKGRAPLLHAWWLSMMGRLKPDWTVQRAHAHILALSPGIMRATMSPNYKPDMATKFLANKLEATAADTGVSRLRREYERPLWLLMAITGLVLLIACANLANLLMARASVREREMAVRLAIGASRWRVVRQLLAESLLLAVAGAASGMALAQVLSRGLLAFLNTAERPLFVGLSLNWTVLGFTAGLAVITCLLFGLIPAVRSSQMQPSSAMRSGGRGSTAGPERFSLRRALVTMQVALSLVLLAGALLFVRSLQNLMTTDAGFKPEGVLVVSVDFSKAQYAKEQRVQVYRELQEKMSALPGVVSAAQVSMTPVSGSGWDGVIGADGAVAAGSGKVSNFNRIAPGYFRTMGTPLLAGRDFDERDRAGSPKVAIVNEIFARKYFGTANVVGHTFHTDAWVGKPEPLYEIVGVVKNTKYYELREEFLPIGYFPMAHEETPSADANFVLRIAGSPANLMTAAKTAIASVNPAMGIQFRIFSSQLKESLLRERLMATLSGGFGILAGLLATLGLYGVIAYMVARRQSEIGVRIALGASRGQVIRLVLREALVLLGAGLPVGILLALWAGRAASTMLYGVKPFDVTSMAAATALLAAVALVASYGPARRAAAVEPVAALRQE